MSIVISLVLFAVTFIVTAVAAAVMTVWRFGSVEHEERTILETAIAMACLMVGSYWFFQTSAELVSMGGVVFLDGVRRVSAATVNAEMEISKVSSQRTDNSRKKLREKFMTKAVQVAISVASDLKPGSVVYSGLLGRYSGDLRRFGIFHVEGETFVVEPRQFQIVGEFIHCDGEFISLDNVSIDGRHGWRKGVPAGDALDRLPYTCADGALVFSEV